MAKIITFSGLDGVGKTSYSNKIKKIIEKRNFSVKIVHIGHFKLFQKNNDKPQIKTSLLKFPLIFLKDIYQILLNQIRYRKYDYLIFDRFYLDTLVKLEFRYKKKYYSLKKICSLLIKNTYSIYLECNLDTSYQRDNDHDLNYHIKKKELYNQYKSEFNLIINTEKEISNNETLLNKILDSF
ncbi:MAG: hypothetical protein ACOCP8_07345 [archaeon]